MRMLVGTGVLGWLLMLLCAGTGCYCAARFCLRRAAPRADRAADATEALMALGMAAMAAGLRAPTGWWVGVYGSAALASGVAVLLAAGHRTHHAYHLVGHGAMVYMALVMGAASAPGGAPAMDGMAGMPAGAGHGSPAVTGALLLVFLLLALRFGLRLTAVPAGAAPARTLLHAPALPDACRVVMGLAMATMLALL